MRDTLPGKINDKEYGIVNLDISKTMKLIGRVIIKNKDMCYYFDSFGLDPLIELQKYMNTGVKSKYSLFSAISL